MTTIDALPLPLSHAFVNRNLDNIPTLETSISMPFSCHVFFAVAHIITELDDKWSLSLAENYEKGSNRRESNLMWILRIRVEPHATRVGNRFHEFLSLINYMTYMSEAHMHYDYCNHRRILPIVNCQSGPASCNDLAQGASKRFQEHVYWPSANTHGFS